MNQIPNTLPEHSPLGASGASRWMKCPGSVSLSAGINDPESEFAALGLAAHDLGEHCLKEGKDAWECIGSNCSPHGEVDSDMSDAVQVYLNAIRTAHPDRDQSNSFIEREFYCPDLHEYFYGRADFTYYDAATRTLHVWDYKHGAGIVVDVEGNVQCMYYGVGMLHELDLWGKVDTVVLHIVQPRGFHYDGPVRSWAISTVDLEDWLDDVLLPAMDTAMTSTETASGEHCRFCPARRRACPQLLKDFDELEELMALAKKKGGAKALTNAQVGRFLKLFGVAKIVAKNAKDIAFERLQAGKKIPGQKLAHSRVNRAWKDDAEPALVEEFGEDALTKPELKSPAQIDKLPGGTELTERYAFKPEGGLTVVAEGDARAAVNKDTKALFKKEGKKE